MSKFFVKMYIVVAVMLYTAYFLSNTCFANYCDYDEDCNVDIWFNLNDGTYEEPQKLKIGADDGATIYYTTDGSYPNWNSTEYCKPIKIKETTTVKARAYKEETWSDLIQVTITICDSSLREPVISPNGGNFTQPQYISIYSPDGGIIRYTTDGSEPEEYSLVYTGSIYVSGDMTISAKVYKDGDSSEAVYADFSILDSIVTTSVTASPSTGVYYYPQRVTLYSDYNSSIRYTTDNSEPNEWSSLYCSPIYVDRTMTIKAKAYRNGYFGPTSTFSYVMNGCNYYDDYHDDCYDDNSSIDRARELYDDGQYDEAIRLLTSYLDVNEDNDEAMLLLTECYVENGNIRSALDKLKEFVYSYEYPEVVNRYAELCNEIGKYKEAKEKITEILPKYSEEEYLYKTLLESFKGLGISGVRVFVYGEEVDFSQYDNVRPIINEGRTLIPIRALSEALGAEVDWEYRERKATISLDDNIIELWDKDKTAIVNGAETRLDVPAFIYKERLLIPIRFISEKFERSVDWFSIDNKVSIIGVYN